MSENLHLRAQRLLSQRTIEGLRPEQDAWLRAHLAECVECGREAAAMQEALQGLRSVPALVPKDLAARTQLRVRLRAQEVSRDTRGSLLLWIVTAASWLLGVLSAPMVWRAVAWAGGNFGVPKLVLDVGFLLWWTVPALIALGVVLHQRAMSTGSKGI